MSQLKRKLVVDRLETYYDFMVYLTNVIYDYYLDKETLSDDDDIYNHFMFCYNKSCKIFLEEEIDFTDNEELIDYLYEYYYINIYKSVEENNINFILYFWDEIFDIYSKNKNPNLNNILIELYDIFDNSINIKKYNKILA